MKILPIISIISALTLLNCRGSEQLATNQYENRLLDLIRTEKNLKLKIDHFDVYACVSLGSSSCASLRELTLQLSKCQHAIEKLSFKIGQQRILAIRNEVATESLLPLL
jgi:hypothetical protein